MVNDADADRFRLGAVGLPVERPPGTDRAGQVDGDTFAELARRWLQEAGARTAALPPDAQAAQAGSVEALAREIRAFDRARLAASAYARTGGPAGWERITAPQMREGIPVRGDDGQVRTVKLRPRHYELSRDSLVPGTGRHRAVLFHNPAEGRYALAFEGSGSDVLERFGLGPDLADWVNNFSQDAGQVSPYYDAARELMRDLKAELSNRGDDLELARATRSAAAWPPTPAS